jgi:alkaline phosphatase
MNRKTFTLYFALVSLLVSSCSSGRMSSSELPEARNVILLIGDGMGLSHLHAAMTVAGEKLNIERAPVTGLQKPSSASHYITDSAAAGTAIASGTKTKNGAIGVDAEGTRVKSILEIAEDEGLSTGLVSTSSLTHATPAAFIAHQASRGSYEDIARDFLATDIDVFIGGGYDHFAKRKDNLNLTDSLKARGYVVTTTLDEVLKSTAPKLAGFTAAIHSPYRLKGRGDMLPSATSKAIEILAKNKNGFFLMVEGSQIDWAAHANAADTVIDETIDFDRAVGVAIDFAEKDGQTLVIITSDHETGGVTIVGGDLTTSTVKLNFSSKDHTAVIIPVFAYGPGAERFNGIYENTGIFFKIKEAFGFR